MDGNVREASPVVSARPLHVENSVPLAKTTTKFREP
jgi:hypothetical protein